MIAVLMRWVVKRIEVLVLFEGYRRTSGGIGIVRGWEWEKEKKGGEENGKSQATGRNLTQVNS